MKKILNREWRNETGKERKPTEGGLSSLWLWSVTRAHADQETLGNGVGTCLRVIPPEEWENWNIYKLAFPTNQSFVEDHSWKVLILCYLWSPCIETEGLLQLQKSPQARNKHTEGRIWPSHGPNLQPWWNIILST